MKKKMIRFLLAILLMWAQSLVCHCIVFIHVGPSLPEYFFDALAQTRLFNTTCPIYLIADKQTINTSRCNSITDKNFHLVFTESLLKTRSHEIFLRTTGLRQKYDKPFWIYASERFFYLDEFMNQNNIEDVFHIEYDNMLYVDLSELLHVFKQNYSGIGAVFDNDSRCIPNVMFIAHKNCISELANYMASNARKGLNDMEIIALFKNEHNKNVIDNLPIIMDSYNATYGLKSTNNHTTINPQYYSNNCDHFNSIFDGACLGQFLYGTVLPHLGKGFINETCLFNPARLQYEWHRDSQGRNIPYAKLNDKLIRINNLHMHSKKLYLASSTR